MLASPSSTAHWPVGIGPGMNERVVKPSTGSLRVAGLAYWASSGKPCGVMFTAS